jgi:hypothetical protein
MDTSIASFSNMTPPITPTPLDPLNLWGCVSGNLRRLCGRRKQTKGGGEHQEVVVQTPLPVLIC